MKDILIKGNNSATAIDALIRANNAIEESISEFRNAAVTMYGKESGEEMSENFAETLGDAALLIEEVIGKIFYLELCAERNK